MYHQILIIFCIIVTPTVFSLRLLPCFPRSRLTTIGRKQIISNTATSLNLDISSGMIELDGSPTTYGILFAVTMIPALAFVKFVGDKADTSRGSLSEKTQTEFKKRMMQQPNLNLTIPSSEEEDLKKQIAKAYMQDKDVDVGVLEERLRKRAQWRKEMMTQARRESAESVDDEGW